MRVIVDTNVPVVANRNQSPQASPECVLVCVAKIEEIRDRHILVLDDAWRILTEYQNNLRSSGQPGVGDAFLKWVLTNRQNPQRCELVHIALKANSADENDFEVFPDDPDLVKFDKSDRKFVAVALQHPAKPSTRPPILVAEDIKDWQPFQQVLAQYGVQVDFLCSRPLK